MFKMLLTGLSRACPTFTLKVTEQLIKVTGQIFFPDEQQLRQDFLTKVTELTQEKNPSHCTQTP